MSSISGGASTNGSSRRSKAAVGVWYQTFHSSTLSDTRRRLRLRPATASAVAATVSIMRSRSSEAARNASVVANFAGS